MAALVISESDQWVPEVLDAVSKVSTPARTRSSETPRAQAVAIAASIAAGATGACPIRTFSTRREIGQHKLFFAGRQHDVLAAQADSATAALQMGLQRCGIRIEAVEDDFAVAQRRHRDDPFVLGVEDRGAAGQNDVDLVCAAP